MIFCQTDFAKAKTQLHSPPPKRQAHFTCGPSRTEAEHPQPRFGVVEQLFHLPMSDDGDFDRGEDISHELGQTIGCERLGFIL